jgi:hypothetical protein
MVDIQIPFLKKIELWLQVRALPGVEAVITIFSNFFPSFRQKNHNIGPRVTTNFSREVVGIKKRKILTFSFIVSESKTSSAKLVFFVS